MIAISFAAIWGAAGTGPPAPAHRTEEPELLIYRLAHLFKFQKEADVIETR